MRMTNEDAIKTMEYLDRNFGDYKPNHDAINMAIDALKGPQWNPCSERLPESENMYERPKHRYLCQRSVCGVNQMFVGARLNHPKGLLDDFWDWYGTKFRDDDVIAWMPLPEQYKEEKE